MQRMFHLTGSALFVALLVVGCGQSPASRSQTNANSTPAAAVHKNEGNHDHGAVAKSNEGDHSGWWCGEHGIPEEECAQCNSKLAAEFQKKGDWCTDHDRPDSQCFKCHPELQARFAARYEAKYGKQPPAPNMN